MIDERVKPFLSAPNLAGIPVKWSSVTPDDENDNTGSCVCIYSETAGDLALRFAGDPDTTVIFPVPANYVVSGFCARVLATGTTVTGTILSGEI